MGIYLEILHCQSSALGKRRSVRVASRFVRVAVDEADVRIVLVVVGIDGRKVYVILVAVGIAVRVWVCSNNILLDEIENLMDLELLRGEGDVDVLDVVRVFATMTIYEGLLSVVWQYEESLIRNVFVAGVGLVE